MRKIIAYFIGWALALMPAIAWAQTQPIPVVQGRSPQITLVCPAAAGCGPGSATNPVAVELTAGSTPAFDMLGYASAEIFTKDCTNGGKISVHGSQNKSTGYAYIEYPGSTLYLDKLTNGQGFSMPMIYRYVKFVFTSQGANCLAWAVFSPFPSSTSVRGNVASGRQIEAAIPDSYTANYPVVTGGIDSVTGKVWSFAVDDTGALKVSGGGGGAVTAYAPGVPDTVSLSASTSATKCGLTEGSDYEISCTVASAWRHGAATPTALLTDNPLPAGAIRSPVRMPTGSTCFAFISTSAGSCTVSLLPTE